MAGGYFDLPVSSSSRPSNSPDAAGTTNSTPPVSTPNDIPSNGASPHNVGNVQGKPRGHGILKSSNRVKFNVGASEVNTNHPYTALSESAIENNGNAYQNPRPLPPARLPSMEKVPQSPFFDTAPKTTMPAPAPSSSPSRSPSPGLHFTSRPSSPSITWEDQVDPEKGRAIHVARERAQRLASLLSRPSSHKGPAVLSSRYSLPSSGASTPVNNSGCSSDHGDEIPMISIPEKTQDSDDSADDDIEDTRQWRSANRTSEAHRLVRRMARRNVGIMSRVPVSSSSLRSGQITPIGEPDPDLYVERPTHYRSGVLSSLLKLYDQSSAHNDGHDHGRSADSSRRSSFNGDGNSRGTSPEPGWRAQRPRKWYEKSPSQSSTSLTSTGRNSPISMLKRSKSSSSLGSAAARRFKLKPQLEEEIRITVHIAEVLSRQKYLLRLCRALIRFGAPTHRLEEYMVMSARVLELDMQCLYIPGCMIISFGDISTHTTEMNLVRSVQGCDLSRLADVHEIYKEVVHDVIGVEEAIQRLDEVMKRENRFNVWLMVLIHGCACASVGPFAFQARPIDMPIAFFLGCLVGVLQLVCSPHSNIYSNIFEISVAVLMSFLSRAFGSITYQGQRLFCFSALAQSSIALILPGYVMLCASLELQSRNIVAGSVRLVYAIIYSLFLGFGITIGTALFSIFDSNATFDYSCSSSLGDEYFRFPFVILFTVFIALVNHAKFKQLPVMVVISFAAYVVNFFSAKRFTEYAQISIPSAIASFVIGVLGNLYSRLRHGVAAAAMLPAILVLVPSGLASSGALVSGIASATQLTNSNPNPYTVITNGTQGFMDAASSLSQDQHSTVVLDIGYGMVQIAIAFTVGLFLAALVVYPFGKKRSGLFSF